MKNLRNKNQPAPVNTIDEYLSTSWDVVRMVYKALPWLELISDAIESGDLENLVSQEDIDTLAELNSIVQDATLGDSADFATAAQGALADNAVQLPFATQGEAEGGVDNTRAMTALRVAQAIAVAGAGRTDEYNGSGPPTVNDDESQGFVPGSVWIDQVASPTESYRCSDATLGAAVWIKTTLTADELATVALSGNSDDLTEGVSKLLMTAAERAKLLGIDENATDDLTGAEIATLLFAEPDTNQFTDALLTKLTNLGEGGLLWSTYSTTQNVAKNTGSIFSGMSANVGANLPTDPAVGDTLVIWNNDNTAGFPYTVSMDAGGTNHIRERNVTGISLATLSSGQLATLVCYDAGATKKWHIHRAVTSNAIDSSLFEYSADIETVADQDYVLWFDAPFAGTITTVRTKSESGTCTLTGKIDTTALGGTANSVSSTAEEQAHASDNTFAKGDKIQFTISANSACLNLAVTFYGTRS